MRRLNEKMKEFGAFIIAILAFAAASSVCAVETNFRILSQTNGREIVAAEDALVKIMDVDGSVVAESADVAAPTFDLAPNIYTVVAEQPSTGLFGQKEIEVREDQDDKPIELILSDEDRNEASDPTSAAFAEQDGVCEFDVCQPCEPVCSPCFPTFPECEPTGDFENYPGCWSLLGAIGGLIVVVVPDDDDIYATYDNRYR